MRQPGKFSAFCEAFEKKLDTVNIDEISAEPYCKEYLAHLLRHKKYYLAIYADVLQKLIDHATGPQEKIAVVDVGAGNGLLGIFAKFCGFKKAWTNDIDPKFVVSAESLAKQLDVKMDGFIAGDIRAVKSFCKGDIPDAVVGTDVIEHIYSLDHFFAELKEINPKLVSVFTTGSNPENYFKVRELKKIQLKDELEGGKPGDHHLFGEGPLEPFVKMRQQLIQKHYPQLSPEASIQWAQATRGLHETDIVNAIVEFKKPQDIPVLPGLDSNTCNPLTGSWTERILSLGTYISVYKNAGFTCAFYAGFYNDREAGISRYVKKLLNAAITVFGKKISPYIVIVGYKK